MPKKPAKTPAKKAAPKAAAMDKTPGIVSWNELTSKDPKASKKFYGKMFGWTAHDEDMGGTNYTIFRLPSGVAVGGLWTTPATAECADCPPMWMGYITVPDIKKAVAQAKKLGAEVYKDVTPLAVGKLAILGDPQGATFGLWEFAR